MNDEDLKNYENSNVKEQLFSALVRRASTIADVFFIAAHLIYLVFFLVTGMYIMALVNTASLILYVIMFYFCIKAKKFTLFIDLVDLEFLIFIPTATLLCGFSAGFHLCLIGGIILAFFANYFSKERKGFKRPVIYGLICLAIYLGLFFTTNYVDPHYKLSLLETSLLFVSHATVVVVFIIVILYIFISYARKLEERILRESQIDKLTRIGNRKALVSYYDKLNFKNKNYTLSMIDIDDFKKVNDKYGHLCGDFVLNRVANIAKSIIKDAQIFRYGGEEFVIISEVRKSVEECYNQIEEIRNSIYEYVFQYGDFQIHSSITVGFSEYKPGIKLDDWIADADEKLYFGKKNGKNQVVR